MSILRNMEPLKRQAKFVADDLLYLFFSYKISLDILCESIHMKIFLHIFYKKYYTSFFFLFQSVICCVATGPLILTTPWADSADNKLVIFFSFYLENRIGLSCKLSP